MNRTDIINSLIKKIDAQHYLEIGVANGTNFNKILCSNKIGVDPNTNSTATIHQTSDNFFKNNAQTFDIIFIDGLHFAEQVYRDINNSILSLSNNGYIICHDMLPPSEEYQLVPPVQNLWTGDCWKAWVVLRSTRPDLKMHTVDTDFGCGIISRGEQELIRIHNTQPLTWNDYVENKNHWMNIISTSRYKQIYNI